MGCNNERGLDPSVSDRVTGEIQTFTEALEGAMANPTPEALDKLEEAADRLMRATGRVLIELGRRHAKGRDDS